jgi:uncharacterized pyridoxamine 5'-phosphate oxidase family protein
MDFLAEFGRIMKTSQDIAFATAVGEQPNVRRLGFIWNDTEKKLYFSTFKDTPKTVELGKNGKIAFFTIPKDNTEAHVRVNDAIAKLSAKTLAETKADFVSKYPMLEEAYSTMGFDPFVLYEIQIEKAEVFIGLGNSRTITL